MAAPKRNTKKPSSMKIEVYGRVKERLAIVNNPLAVGQAINMTLDRYLVQVLEESVLDMYYSQSEKEAILSELRNVGRENTQMMN